MGMQVVVTCVRALSVAALVVALGCSKPPPTIVTLKPAEMHPTGRFTVGRDGGVTFWSNGELKSEIHAEKGPIAIAVRGWGNTVAGEPPQILFDIDGRIVGRIDVDSQELAEYTVSAKVRKTGEHRLRVLFVNHLAQEPILAGRNLYIESVSVSQGG
jgi:hypothetical protein